MLHLQWVLHKEGNIQVLRSFFDTFFVSFFDKNKDDQQNDNDPQRFLTEKSLSRKSQTRKTRLFLLFSYALYMTLTLPFLALDLETTGLNPQTDTIIEIAAIRFDLTLTDEGFSLENIQERGMLINPGCPLSEEVTLITGITESMLA